MSSLSPDGQGAAVGQPHSPRPPQAVRLALVLLPLLLVAAIVASLLIGVSSLGGSDVGALLHARADRTAVGVLVGAAVAVSGAMLQGLTRNPLADASILGLNAGSALLVVIGITAFSINSLILYAAFSLVGAVIGAACVVGLASIGARAGSGGTSGGPLALALAGMVFTAGAVSVAQAILVADQQSLDVYRYWQVGSVGGRQIVDVLPVSPLFIVGFAVALFAGRRLDILSMGDSVARGLGEKPGRMRVVLGAAAILLAAASTAIAGPIPFIGLVAPHVLRPLIGTSYRVLVPASAFAGAIIVVLADTLGRVVASPNEVQVGIMAAVLGCPVLLWVVARMRSL